MLFPFLSRHNSQKPGVQNKFSLFTPENKCGMMWLTKAKKRNSICLIWLQRAAGCCETAEDTQRTHLGAAAWNHKAGCYPKWLILESRCRRKSHRYQGKGIRNLFPYRMSAWLTWIRVVPRKMSYVSKIEAQGFFLWWDSSIAICQATWWNALVYKFKTESEDMIWKDLKSTKNFNLCNPHLVFRGPSGRQSGIDWAYELRGKSYLLPDACGHGI